MTGRVSAVLGATLLALSLAGCGEKPQWEPPSRETQVAEAEAQYDETLFDSISWDDSDDRLFRGNEVFASECRTCHASDGQGMTEYARSRELQVPSLVREPWPEGDSLEWVRRRVYTGHPRGMPTWGVAGISPRQIDAVAYFVVEGLRRDDEDE